MKKIILGLAATALIFASCSKDETTSVNNGNPNAIGFEAGTGKVIGRAASNDIDALTSSADGFGVYATNGATPVEFIDNKAYHYNIDNWKWKDADIKWPLATTDYPINFYAYYPQAGLSLDTDLDASYTVADDVADQVDYLAAQTTGVAVRPSDSKVTLDFKHIMSKVDFKVSAGAGMTVIVQSIKVKQVGNSGTFNFEAMDWSEAPTAFTSSYDYLVAPVKDENKFVNNTTTAAAAAAVTADNGSMILMPQDLSGRAWDATAVPAGNSYIEVVYRVIATATDEDIVGLTDATQHPSYAASDVTGPLFVKVGYSLPTDWAMNKAYTYVLRLGDPESTGGNLIDNKFVDEDGDDTDLPVIDVITDEELDVLDPICNSDGIGFTVSVSAWEDEDSDIEL